MRFVKTLIVPFMLAASVSAQVPEQRVSVAFSATDAKGNPIRDLSKEQVFVYDNNQPVPTLDVQNASDLPLHLGIVLLASKKNFNQEQAAVIELAQKVLRPGKDQAFIVTAGGEKPWPNPRLDWLTDTSAVAETVRGLDKNTGLPDAFNYQLTTDSMGTRRLAVQNYNVVGGSSVFDVVWAMMKTDPGPARRAVVIFRRATAHSPGFGERSSQAGEDNHHRVITMAQVLGVAVFTIGVEDQLPALETARSDIGNVYAPQSAGEGSAARVYDQNLAREKELQYSAGRHNVDRIADETGGRSWWTTKKNYSDAVAGIANELAAQFVVSFAPATGPAAGAVHPLKVQVSRATRVSAPRAYILPTEKKANQ